MISQIGYGLSVVALTGAIFITLYFRRLRCARNMLHINLYASFIARAVLTFLRNWLFVLGLGFLKDFRVKADSSLEFREDISHWECKLFMTIFNYAMMTNCTWIFVEGLYIHTIIFFDIFLESTSIKGYVALGWGVSLLFLLPWVLVKLTLDNSYCWNIQLIEGTFWIIKGPLVVSVLINFVFFVNVVRVLFTKLKANSSSECRTNRHKTFARSTLVLIPLFGVPYIVFLGLPENLSVVAELVKIYFEITFNSFNGFLVAILFCYLNGEVQNELKKAWNLHSLKRNANWRCSQTENVFLEQFAVVQQRNGVCKKEVHKIFTRGKL